MEDRHRVVTWSASVLAGALSVVILAASRARVSLWHDSWFVVSAGVAAAAFLILVASGTPDLVGWIRNRGGRLPSVVISNPEADQCVSHAVTARGSAARIPDSITLW